MLGISKNSHISADGAERLRLVFEILNENNLIGSDKNYCEYFGIIDESKSTWWSAWQYSRNRMENNLKTKDYLVNNVNIKTNIENKNIEFTDVFLLCARKIKIYLEKRNHWYLQVSKDRVIFIDKIIEFIEEKSSNSEEEKINCYSKLVKNLFKLKESKIWKGRDFDNTSINEVIYKVILELSYHILISVTTIKTKSIAVSLSELDKNIGRYERISKSAVDNNFSTNFYDINDKFNAISQSQIFNSGNTKTNGNHEVSVYFITENEFKKNQKIGDINLKHECLFFRVELKSGIKTESIYLSSVLKNVKNENDEIRKIRIKYRAHLIANYIVCRLWFLEHARKLVDLSNIAFDAALNYKTKPSQSSAEYVLYEKSLIANKFEVITNKNVQSNSEDKRQSLVRTSISAKQLLPVNDNYPRDKNPFETSNKKNNTSVKKKIKNFFHFGKSKSENKNKKNDEIIGTQLPIGYQNYKDKLNEKLYKEPVVQIKSSFLTDIENCKNLQKVRLDRNFIAEGGNLERIEDFEKWADLLNTFALLNFETVKSYEDIISVNSLENASKDVCLNIQSLVNDLLNYNNKALARLILIPIHDSEQYKKLYSGWIKSNCTIDKLWENLCIVVVNEKIPANDSKKILKQLKSL